MKDQLCDHCSGYGLHREYCIVPVAHNVLYENPDLVALIRDGKTAMGLLVGKVIQQRKGNCSPTKVYAVLWELLNEG